MFYVYLLQSKNDNSIYIGYTTDLRKRLAAHNKGCGKATKDKLPWELIYYESYKDQTCAVSREKRLKNYGRALQQLKKRIGL